MLHRRSIRYEGYDYASEGVYFVTLVTHHHEYLFGKIENGIMNLNDFGRIAREEWFKTSILRPNIELEEDEFVVMPNHIHGIIWITESQKDLSGENPSLENANDSQGTGDLQVARTSSTNQSRPRGPTSNSVGSIIAGFKSSVTTKINTIRKTPGQPVWLRNYYEHIIETKKEYFNIANYIHDNPGNWGTKDEYFS